MIPEYRNTGNTDQDDADNIGSIIALDDTSDMAMGSVFEDADKHKQGAVLHWKRDIIRHVYPAALILFDIWLIASIFIIANYIRYDEEIITTVSRRILLVIEMSKYPRGGSCRRLQLPNQHQNISFYQRAYHCFNWSFCCGLFCDLLGN